MIEFKRKEWSQMFLYLVRHPETTYNADSNRYSGRSDVGLSDRGREQSQRVVRYFQDRQIDGVWSSPLLRAREMAQAVADKAGSPLIVDQRLIEMDFGVWEGLTPEEIESLDAEMWRRWLAGDPDARPPEGESLSAVHGRAVASLDEIASRLAPRGTGLLVGHSVINRILITHMIGIPYGRYRTILQGNGRVTLMERPEDGAHWVIHFMNHEV